jgi:hypothetical protein
MFGRNLFTFLLLILLSILSSLPALSWDSSDEKSVAQLELMDDAELAEQAKKACWSMAMYNKLKDKYDSLSSNYSRAFAYKQQKIREWQQAHNYLDTIRLVVRKKHNGDTPDWVGQMQEASRGTEYGPCSAVAMQILEEKLAVPMQILEEKIRALRPPAAAPKTKPKQKPKH